MARSCTRVAILLVLALGATSCGGDPGTTAGPASEPDVAATSEPVRRTGPPASAAPKSTSKPVQRTAPPATSAPATSTGLAASQLDIPAIGLSTSLIGLGLNEDGTVEVPQDPARAGWFDLGTVPGQGGSAVILGHVDSLTGPAVFADLATLRAGDDISIGLSDATVVTFEVQEVATFANADFPAQRVYAGSRDRATLNLVTCGGDYDRDRGGYQANVVVFTERVSD